MNALYLQTARLLTQVAPTVFADGQFALKGGTAINLFLRDMPRLSVDLDLVFVDYCAPRERALASINDSIRQMGERLSKRGFQTRSQAQPDTGETKLFVRRDGIEVKIEVNTVMRGTVHPVRAAGLSAKARDVLLAELEVPVASLEDVYGGKMVAAMDRQHPRDLFDVMQLLAHEGITPGIRRAFIVYLASHNRPIHEVLFPSLKDLRQDYERSFVGMTEQPVALADLLAVREQMTQELQQGLDADERRFLLSLAANEPDWACLGIAHLDQLPAIRWKLHNLGQLQSSSPEKFETQYKTLGQRLIAAESV